MKKLFLIIVALLPVGCWGKGGGKLEVFEQTILPHRVAGLSPSEGPQMYTVVIGDDGAELQMFASANTMSGPDGPRLPQWGMRYVVRIHRVYNPTWKTSSRVVESVLEELEDVSGTFSLLAMTPGHFGADRRSFVDGKQFVCEPELLCGAIDEALEAGATVDLHVRFGDTWRAPVVVTAVSESAQGATQ